MSKKWVKSQKKHARELFDLARDREYAVLMEEIRKMTKTGEEA
ncbi:hypothetical protein [Sulfurovum sp.]|nr:hypothetical protein [Sulfurovum sp.]